MTSDRGIFPADYAERLKEDAGKSYCPTHTSYVTEFPADFIAAYKIKWGK